MIALPQFLFPYNITSVIWGVQLVLTDVRMQKRKPRFTGEDWRRRGGDGEEGYCISTVDMGTGLESSRFNLKGLI